MFRLSALFMTLLFWAYPVTAAGDRYWVYVGCYTDGPGQGIQRFSFDASNGQFSQAEVAAELASPSFLAIHPSGKYLYAVSESGSGGTVHSYSIDQKTGALKVINVQPSEGNGPCHVNTDKTGKCLLVANYGSGSVACLGIAEDGSLQKSKSFHQHKGKSVHPTRQQAPHAHSVNVSIDNRFVVAADLGTDELVVYELDAASATITPRPKANGKMPPGSGPRHFTFDSEFGYKCFVCGELDSTISLFYFKPEDNRFELKMTLPTIARGDASKNSTAEILLHPSDNKWVLVSNRGTDNIAIFETRSYDKFERGSSIESPDLKTPRNFCFEPKGRWILAAGQDSNQVVVFGWDKTGNAKNLPETIKVRKPVCIRFVSIEQN